MRILKEFHPTRKIGGKLYVYYNSYSSKRYAEIKAKSIIGHKGNHKTGKFIIIKKDYNTPKPYAVFVHWGGKS
jgi:hypothetical protein